MIPGLICHVGLHVSLLHQAEHISIFLVFSKKNMAYIVIGSSNVIADYKCPEFITHLLWYPCPLTFNIPSLVHVVFCPGPQCGLSLRLSPVRCRLKLEKPLRLTALRSLHRWPQATFTCQIPISAGGVDQQTFMIQGW